jgi:outer membrane lipoprotein SlyB
MENTGFRKTHPLLLGAAASVMVVSLMGAAAIGGLLPNAHSDKTEVPAQKIAPVAEGARSAAPQIAARDSTCAACGTVESIHAVELKGNASGLGAVAGGVTGAVVGNQMGRGHGNTAMTLLGAAGGALAGNTIEKQVNKRYSYRVKVRMDDGTYRAVSQIGAPAVDVGDRVRIANGALLALL